MKLFILQDLIISISLVLNMASIQDKVYLTPLDLAVDRNHSDIAKFLGANGALTMAKIVGIAATRIQALYRSIFFSDICIIVIKRYEGMVNKLWNGKYYTGKLKLRYCEKATKFLKISHLFWH